MTRLALGILVGACLYATASLLAFHPEGADSVYRRREVASCSCREAK